MALLAVLTWVTTGVTRRPAAWATAATTGLYLPLVDALAPYGIASSSTSSAPALEVAFAGATVGAWLGADILGEGEALWRGRGALGTTLLRGAALTLSSSLLALPALLAAALSGRSLAGAGPEFALALFHLAGVALLVDRWWPAQRGIALFAACWVLPFLVVADRARAGIVIAIPGALVPTWPGSVAPPGAPAALLAGIALWGAAGLLHRPQRPHR